MFQNTSIIHTIAVVLLCIVPVFSFAQNPTDSTTQVVRKSPKSLVEDFMNAEKEKKAIGAPQVISGDRYATDERLDSIRLEAWKQYYGYMTKGYSHRSTVFTWQLLSSVIIFVVVIFLVFAGIYFAWLQFKASLYGSSDEAGKLSTELSASMKEIKVSSPVLGVIILVISLFFFYLYLVYVYPIHEIF